MRWVLSLPFQPTCPPRREYAYFFFAEAERLEREASFPPEGQDQPDSPAPLPLPFSKEAELLPLGDLEERCPFLPLQGLWPNLPFFSFF